jgi:signal transduction histidine kinase
MELQSFTARTRSDQDTQAMRREIDRLLARVGELEQDRASLEAFAAHAAHEMMQPLVMTEAYAALIAERLAAGQEDSLRDLATVSRAAARTRVLLEGILHEARSRDLGPAAQSVDLEAVVRDCVDLLAPEIAARGAEVEVGELPVVTGDPAQLGSVFANLIVNALKFSPRQEAAIRVEAVREPGCWRLDVVSAGPPLAPEDRDRIFGPFSRARGERRERGSGLGLAICRRIVERHGGTIGVVPGEGGGNRFSFTLPA